MMLAVVVLATRILTPVEQGFFFALMSVGALAQVGDFGLCYAVLQKSSHLKPLPEGNADPLYRQVRLWSLRVTALSTSAIVITGAISLSLSDDATRLTFDSLFVAIASLAALFCGQAAAPLLALREGRGQVTGAWRKRMLQEWSGGTACVIALCIGAGTYSIAMYWIGRTAVVLPLLFSKTKETPDTGISWRNEIWPFQWRIGLSNLSGFFIFRATTLVVIAEQGAVEAGRYGLALAAMNMMLAVTAAWPGSAATRLGQLIAAGQPLVAAREAKTIRHKSTAFAACAALAAWALFALASKHDLEMARRMADPVTLALILATGLVHHIVSTQAVLLRAQIREPLLTISIVGGIANLTCACIAAHYGPPSAIAATSLACALIGLMVSGRLLAAQCKTWKEATSCACQNT